jgi:hypothetical protein
VRLHRDIDDGSNGENSFAREESHGGKETSLEEN